ncbi:MAG: SpoIIE family protein phosphatase [Spirochaetes bacterium]|nr:SpoIIE family protein phosphatase [Spirochaetota bacterium]
MKRKSVRVSYFLSVFVPSSAACLLSIAVLIARDVVSGSFGSGSIPFLATLVSAMVGGSALVAALVGSSLAEPVLGLAAASRSLSGLENGSSTAGASRGDEFGDIAGGVDKLAADLKENMARLDELVSDRTEELSSAYSELRKRNETIQRELRMAHRVQLKMIPRLEDLPERPELSMAAWYGTKENVGGDLYDVLRIGRNAYGLLVADVSGHGVPSALITAMVKSAFRNRARWGVPAAVVLKDVNDELVKVISETNHYVTAYFGIINLEDGSFEYSCAGHHPALLRTPSGEIARLDCPGSFLGVFEDASFESRTIRVGSGSRILIYTDGIIEARNRANEDYSIRRLEAFFSREADACPRDFIDALMKDVENFTGGAPRHDDQAVMLMELKGLCDVRAEAQELELLPPAGEPGDFPPPGPSAEPPSRPTELLTRGRFDEARTMLLGMLERRPADPGILNDLGIAEYRLGRFAEARSAFARAAELDPGEARIARNLELARRGRTERGPAGASGKGRS